MAILDYWELALLGLDGLVVYGFYKAYKNLSANADVIEKLPLYTVGPELYSYVDKMPKKCLSYVAICGLSKMSKDARIQTSKFPSVGLIHKTSKIEHKSIAKFGFWDTVTKKISSVVRSCKFGICAPDLFTSKNDPSFVEVKDPLKAEYLLNKLPIIKEYFVPSNHNINKKDRHNKNREIIKGYQYKEYALCEGVAVFGVGKISIISGQLCFGPPDSIGKKYILTLLTKPQVVDNLRKNAKLSKHMFHTFLSIGTAVAVRLVYKYLSYNPQVVSLRLNAKLSKFMSYTFLFTGAAVTAWMVVKFRLKSRNASIDACEKVDTGVNTILTMSAPSIEIDDNACSVCLTSRRNVLLLPCRHLTICSDCYNHLPSPKCPMCRTLIKECILI